MTIGQSEFPKLHFILLYIGLLFALWSASESEMSLPTQEFGVFSLLTSVLLLAVNITLVFSSFIFIFFSSFSCWVHVLLADFHFEISYRLNGELMETMDTLWFCLLFTKLISLFISLWIVEFCL